MLRLIVLLCAFLLSACNDTAPRALEHVLSMRADDPAGYALTSDDVKAHYLFAALDADRAKALQAELVRTAIHRRRCVGWGLNAAWDAFADGSTNPADTIYAYTTSRVIRALLAAERRGLITVDPGLAEAVACTFTDVIGTAEDHGGFFYPYSDQPSDRHMVVPILGEVAAALADLATRLGRPDLETFAASGFRALMAKQDPAGALPYYPDGKVLPLYHAMSVRDLYACAECQGAADRGVAYLIDHLMLPDGTPADQSNSSGWQHGEFLTVLAIACGRAVTGACEKGDQLVAFLRNASGSKRDNTEWLHNARTQSWAAAGLAETIRLRFSACRAGQSTPVC